MSVFSIQLESRQLNRTTVCAYPPFAAAFAALVSAHGTLYDWASEQPQPRALRGRAPVYVAQLPDSHATTVVVRHAWHGGLFAPLTADFFRTTHLAQRECVSSARLRAEQIPTTEVIGYASYGTLLGWKRVDVVSRFVANAFDLGAIMAGLVPDCDTDAALATTRELLLRMAERRVRHPDLNVKNVLLVRAERGPLTAMVIDVDVVRWEVDRTPRQIMQANLARLLRSLRKWRRQHEVALSDDSLNQFAREALAAMPRT